MIEESPTEETTDIIITSVEVIISTTRNSEAFIASEKLNISFSNPSPQKMYNTAYIARSTSDRIGRELAEPLSDTIARQINDACESSHKEEPVIENPGN